MVKQLDTAYGTGTFFEQSHEDTWKHLNSYTHTGKNQLLSRMTGLEITPNYTDDEKRFVLDSTRTSATITAILFLKAHQRFDDAAKLEQIILRA